MVYSLFVFVVIIASHANGKPVVNGMHATDDLTKQDGQASGPSDKLSVATVGLGAASINCSGIVVEGCILTRPECLEEKASNTQIFTGQHPTKKGRIKDVRTLEGTVHHPIAIAKPEAPLPDSMSLPESILTPLKRISSKDEEVPGFVIGYGNEGVAARTATQGHLSYSSKTSSDVYPFMPIGRAGGPRTPNARLATADRGAALGTYRKLDNGQLVLEVSGLMGENSGADALRAFGFGDFSLAWIRKSLKDMGCRSEAVKATGSGRSGVDELVYRLKEVDRFAPSSATSKRLDETLGDADRAKLADALGSILGVENSTKLKFEAVRPDEQRVKTLPEEAKKKTDQFVSFRVTVPRPGGIEEIYQVMVSSAGWSDVQKISP